MIPKSLAAFVPIVVRAFDQTAAPFVLIDDDPLIRMIWSDAAREAGVELAVYSKAEDFLSVCAQLARNYTA